MKDYESLGVPELWLLWPESRTLDVLQLDAGRLRTIAKKKTGKIAPKLLPQAVIDIESIWP